MIPVTAKTVHARHGVFTYLPEDEFVGRSLEMYKEYSEEEVEALLKMLRPGDVVIEVGANIGAMAVPMAKAVGEEGRVHAFEPHPTNFAILYKNVADNGLDQVTLYPDAVSDKITSATLPDFCELGHHNYGRVELGKGSVLVSTITLDSLNFDKIKLIKVDAEGHERQVIAGARETIKRCKPILYVENDRPEHCGQLISDIIDLGYRCYWHRPRLYRVNNEAGNRSNCFGGIISINMVCVHEDSGIEIKNCDEVADIRVGSRMYEREIERYQRISEKNPEDLNARLLIAHYLNLLQRPTEALQYLDENERRSPNHVPSRAVRGLIALQQKKWWQGWAGYELRYLQKTTEQFGNRPHHGKQWLGQRTDEPVLIWCEQGFGDSIMFARFFDRVKELCPNAFLEVQPQLYELFEMSGIAKGCLYRQARTMPDYAHHCSLPSLPFALGLRYEDEHRAAPYLKADPAMVKLWDSKVLPRVGFCWAGSPRSERPYTRDIDPALFDGFTQRYGNTLSLVQDGQFESYADTAACIKSLNLVITVDTSVAHLAGALGVETWLLLSFDPDWRWGLDSDRCVWYDNVRIFRQPRLMDWQAVVAQVEEAYVERLAARAGLNAA